ncbi:hypothetical protein V5O48_015916 [Marasmius crinis-equi]|uniref:Major facilitator superfamily (MFS) profile domain-containing protein n=1 Tax=Marasmius crinis-equi TaxID=585013 RepID=A0ABR3ET98_9AGAR
MTLAGGTSHVPSLLRTEWSLMVYSKDPEPASQRQASESSSQENAKSGCGNGAENAKEDRVTVVDWDGPDDPNNPKNWTSKRKWSATLIVSCIAFVAPAASSIISPASQQVAEEFGITSDVLLSMITSVYVLGFGEQILHIFNSLPNRSSRLEALGPLLIGPLSEVFGRSRVLKVANLFFLSESPSYHLLAVVLVDLPTNPVWNLACGFSQTTAQLIIFRLLAGMGGSAPLSIGGAVVGDTFHPEERGRAIALYSLGPVLGPAVGPVAGGWIAEKTTWRWVFWATSICNAIVLVVSFSLQETYAPVLLERKARRLVKESSATPNSGSVEKGQDQSLDQADWKASRKHFRTIYEGSSIGIGGLHYFALGFGLLFGSLVNSAIMDRIYIYFKKRNGGEGAPEFRVPILFPASLFLPTGLLLSGWAAQKAVRWFATDVGTFLVGLAMLFSFQSITAYIVDVFTLYAASGLAATLCLRALFAFGFPLFAPAMYKALGLGVGNTVLAALAIAIGCPA